MPDAPHILILNGPNLNLLGAREPEVYGRQTLADVERDCHRRAAERGLAVEARQSNSEGQLVDWIQEARNRHAGLIINPGAYSHSSIAMLDALLAVGLPAIEVHLSNIYRRESFRHHSYISRGALGIICGFGVQGYLLAIDAMAHLLETQKDV